MAKLIDLELWIEIKGRKYEKSMDKFAEFCKSHKAELWDKDKLKQMSIL